jgi:hypothetical protein
MISSTPELPAIAYVSSPVYHVPAKLATGTVYMPSQVAARLLGSTMSGAGMFVTRYDIPAVAPVRPAV